MILSGKSIEKLAIMDPFLERTQHQGMSHGVGPAGYDVRVEFDSRGEIIGTVLLPGEFLLCSTIERFIMPGNVMGIVHDKSSWARKGIAVQNTVIEPGWQGYLTLELTNHGSKSRYIPRGVGIAQIIFHYIDEDCAEYDGKYNNQQRGPVAAK
jgi:dCTP deaminase